MQKWEYVTVPLLTHATKQILDGWGEQGYELVTGRMQDALRALAEARALPLIG